MGLLPCNTILSYPFTHVPLNALYTYPLSSEFLNTINKLPRLPLVSYIQPLLYLKNEYAESIFEIQVTNSRQCNKIFSLFFSTKPSTIFITHADRYRFMSNDILMSENMKYGI